MISEVKLGSRAKKNLVLARSTTRSKYVNIDELG